MGGGLFAVGVVFTLLTFGPFFFGVDERPLLLNLGALLAPGEPLGLEEAGRALVAMGSTPSRGIVLVDPAR